jgi:hypothetical protein
MCWTVPRRSKLSSCLPTDALSSPIHSCTAATAGLTTIRYSGYYRVTTNAQLLGLSTCTSIDYLLIMSCADCTQVAWCGLQLQSISGKDPTYGHSLYLYNTPGISDMCGVKNLKGALTGGFWVWSMNGVVSLDGAEGITSVGVDSDGYSIALANTGLTSAIALANTEYPTGTLWIDPSNSILECVPSPSAWPATDKNGNTIPHSCPTTAPTPAPTAPTASPTTAAPTVAPTVDAVR